MNTPLTGAPGNAVRSVIVALGAGLDGGAMARLKKRNDPRSYLSIGRLTRLRAAAAAVMYRRDPGSVIIFSGGHTLGNTWISEGEAMREYVARHKKFAVPRSRIIVETEATDTVSNVRNIAEMLKKFRLNTGSHITLIAGRRQMESAVAYFRALGIVVHPLLVRQALGAIARSYVIPSSVDAPLSREDRKRGWILRLIRIVDPRGAIVSMIAKRQRRNTEDVERERRQK